MSSRGLVLGLVRTKTDTADDDDPNTSEPAEADIFAPPTYSEGGKSVKSLSFRFKVVTADDSDAKLTLWFRNDNPDDDGDLWSRGDSRTIPSGYLLIEDDAEDARTFFQLTDLGGSAAPIKVYAQEGAAP